MEYRTRAYGRWVVPGPPRATSFRPLLAAAFPTYFRPNSRARGCVCCGRKLRAPATKLVPEEPAAAMMLQMGENEGKLGFRG